jgi:hypothetical protein
MKTRTGIGLLKGLHATTIRAVLPGSQLVELSAQHSWLPDPTAAAQYSQ